MQKVKYLAVSYTGAINDYYVLKAVGEDEIAEMDRWDMLQQDENPSRQSWTVSGNKAAGSFRFADRDLGW